MIALVVMTDGRKDYLKKTIESAKNNLIGSITEQWMHDDTGDEEERNWLRKQYPDFIHIGVGPRRGFGGAYSYAWETLSASSNAQYFFSLEDDFIFNRPIPLNAMAKILDENPHLYQMALRRQAWNDEEKGAGGIIERWPNDFEEIRLGDLVWLEHRRWYTTNPNLYKRSSLDRSWPTTKDAEGHFGIQLFSENPKTKCGYWGKKTDAAWVTHIGEQRSEGTY